MENRFHLRVLPSLGLSFILAVYAFAVIRLHPADFFGLTQDDSIYLSSAKALANHQGYILPSVPGMPAATKYPILYPWILSFVWRIKPSFPGNLPFATAITMAFGAIFVVTTFIFLRQLKGIGDNVALVLTFVVALHPVTLFYSAGVLSDVPFAALALTALLIGDTAMRPAATDVAAAGCACLTGLSILMRIFGIPVAVGILVAALLRRAWRQIGIFCGVLFPICVAIFWRQIFAPSHIPHGPAQVAGGSGFAAAWSYYTSYPGFWKLSVPNAHILWAMLTNNAAVMLHSPSDYFLFPLLTRDTVASRSLMVILTVGIFAGIVRQARSGEWKSIHFALPFYAALALLWNYPDPNGRFFILFLPLFASGLWMEARHSLALVSNSFTKSRIMSDRIVAGALGFCLVALFCAMAWNYAHGSRAIIAELGKNRAALLREKQQAYQWISSSTSQSDRVIAYEDASLYLYTGRQSMRPAVFNTAGLYDPSYIRDSVAHITDVARGTHARYWLFADDDFSLEGEAAITLGRARESDLERNLPLVFQSQQGHVRIYELSCKAKLNPGLCP